VLEPQVQFSVPSIQFQRVLVGRRASAEVQLVNDEDVDFTFELDKSSYDATDDVVRTSGRQPSVTLEPWRGTIAPRSKQCLNVSFTPQDEKAVNFSVVCNIKQKSDPLTLNIKGQGFLMLAKLCVQTHQGTEVSMSSRVRCHSSH
jgi:hydrocephalus-inducing protein